MWIPTIKKTPLSVYNCVLLYLHLFFEPSCSVAMFSSCHSFILSVVFLWSKEVESIIKAFGGMVPKWVLILNSQYVSAYTQTVISMLALSPEALLALLLATSIRVVNGKSHSENTIALNGWFYLSRLSGGVIPFFSTQMPTE